MQRVVPVVTETPGIAAAAEQPVQRRHLGRNRRRARPRPAASMPTCPAIDSFRRAAALPVGAASRMRRRGSPGLERHAICSRPSRRTTVVVLPVPGPPVITLNPPRAASAQATFCQSTAPSVGGEQAGQPIGQRRRDLGHRVQSRRDRRGHALLVAPVTAQVEPALLEHHRCRRVFVPHRHQRRSAQRIEPLARLGTHRQGQRTRGIGPYLGQQGLHLDADMPVAEFTTGQRRGGKHTIVGGRIERAQEQREGAIQRTQFVQRHGEVEPSKQAIVSAHRGLR